MVFFTCNACGQAIKKAQVEKHYRTKCRQCEVLSCIDCGKDFYGDEYKQHTQCISENEKYGGRDYQAPSGANKGEAKQEQWLQCIREACSASNASSNIRSLLEKIAEYPNVPRKRKKFENFVSNSLKIRNPKIMDQVWSVFSTAAEQEKSQATTSKEKQDVKVSVSSPKKNKKTLEESSDSGRLETVEHDSEQNGNKKLKEKKKKKKKRDKDSDECDDDNEARKKKEASDEQEDGDKKRKKDKKKKQEENVLDDLHHKSQIHASSKKKKKKQKTADEKEETEIETTEKKKKKKNRKTIFNEFEGDGEIKIKEVDDKILTIATKKKKEKDVMDDESAGTKKKKRHKAAYNCDSTTDEFQIENTGKLKKKKKDKKIDGQIHEDVMKLNKKMEGESFQKSQSSEAGKIGERKKRQKEVNNSDSTTDEFQIENAVKHKKKKKDKKINNKIDEDEVMKTHKQMLGASSPESQSADRALSHISLTPESQSIGAGKTGEKKKKKYKAIVDEKEKEREKMGKKEKYGSGENKAPDSSAEKKKKDGRVSNEMEGKIKKKRKSSGDGNTVIVPHKKIKKLASKNDSQPQDVPKATKEKMKDTSQSHVGKENRINESDKKEKSDSEMTKHKKKRNKGIENNSFGTDFDNVKSPTNSVISPDKSDEFKIKKKKKRKRETEDASRANYDHDKDGIVASKKKLAQNEQPEYLSPTTLEEGKTQKKKNQKRDNIDSNREIEIEGAVYSFHVEGSKIIMTKKPEQTVELPIQREKPEPTSSVSEDSSALKSEVKPKKKMKQKRVMVESSVPVTDGGISSFHVEGSRVIMMVEPEKHLESLKDIGKSETLSPQKEVIKSKKKEKRKHEKVGSSLATSEKGGVHTKSEEPFKKKLKKTHEISSGQSISGLSTDDTNQLGGSSKKKKHKKVTESLSKNDSANLPRLSEAESKSSSPKTGNILVVKSEGKDETKASKRKKKKSAETSKEEVVDAKASGSKLKVTKAKKKKSHKDSVHIHQNGQLPQELLSHGQFSKGNLPPSPDKKSSKKKKEKSKHKSIDVVSHDGRLPDDRGESDSRKIEIGEIDSKKVKKSKNQSWSMPDNLQILQEGIQLLRTKDRKKKKEKKREGLTEKDATSKLGNEISAKKKKKKKR